MQIHLGPVACMKGGYSYPRIKSVLKLSTAYAFIDFIPWINYIILNVIILIFDFIRRNLKYSTVISLFMIH